MISFSNYSILILALIAIGLPVNAQEASSQLSKDQAVIIQRALENSIDKVVRVMTFGGGEFQGTLLTPKLSDSYL